MTVKEARKPNRLIHEKSPYLLQHADNPVDWYPWGEKAFEKAKCENKLIFLSIGYSTCHWCHVMERESFEDEEVANYLNRHYVSVKVDREERPDVDHIYMTVCQMLTGHGGWPLTVILTPDRQAIFAGTYFPKKGKWGRPGLMDILGQIARRWQEDPASLLQAGSRVTSAIRAYVRQERPGELNGSILDEGYRQFAERFDQTYGGFGPAPKFPSPHNLLFLMRYFRQAGEQNALQMVEKTLDGMYRGGIYDHVGFGFARYSTDERWLVPHFEKMLYDNALLAYTYLEAYQATGNDRYAQVARDVFTYVQREMTDPEGGFYSAEDADSEGVEGKFYLWTVEEVVEVLGSERGERVCDWFGISPRGNFEGKSIPNLLHHPSDPLPMADEEMADAREKLFQHRERRVHPHKDDKMLTAWNALMIAAFAKGAKVLNDPAYKEVAEKAAHFILSRLVRSDGRLLARYRDGEAAYPAYLDDYAFLVWGLHELYEATWNTTYLEQAIRFNEDMLRLFWDDERGGCYFTANDGETLLARPKEIYDGAMPSGNSVAAYNLVRLAHLTGDDTLSEKAERQLKAFAGQVADNPSSAAFFLTAAQLALNPMTMIVVAGRQGEAETEQLLREIQQAFLPGALLVFRSETEETIQTLVPITREQQMQRGRATAYVCENYACQAPVTEIAQVRQKLNVGTRSRE